MSGPEQYESWWTPDMPLIAYWDDGKELTDEERKAIAQYAWRTKLLDENDQT